MTGKAAGSTTDRAYVRNFAPDSRGYCRWWTVPTDGTVNVSPKLTGIWPAHGLVGTTVSVTISGSGFGSAATVNAGTGITVSYGSRSDTSISTSFAIAANAAGGNHAVSVTANGQTSSSVNFYVQIPSKLSISNYGGLNVITNGSVVDYFGTIILTHQCGSYRNVVSSLLDQQGGTILGGDFTFTESFSNYTTTINPNPGVPQPESSQQNTSIQPLADIQYLGKNAPNCFGSNDHEGFDQSFKVTLGSNNFPLSTVYHIERGNYSGTAKVDVTVKTP